MLIVFQTAHKVELFCVIEIIINVYVVTQHHNILQHT